MTPKKLLPDDSAAQERRDKLLTEVRHALSHNVQAAMDVAGSEQEEQPGGRLSQVNVSRLTGIARSTLGRIITNDLEKGANPDLVTLVKLAELLDVPPYFLLMRHEDWKALSQASDQYQFIMNDAEVAKEVNSRARREKARAGLAIARKLGIYRPQDVLIDASDLGDEIRADLDLEKRRKERAILTATAITQFSSSDASRLMLTIIGAYVGANQH